MVGDPELAAFDAAIQTAARALNYALRQAAERDLVAKVDLERQDLQGDVNVRIGAATCVRVTLRRHEGPDVSLAE
jgi:hypothetical protein